MGLESVFILKTNKTTVLCVKGRNGILFFAATYGKKKI